MLFREAPNGPIAISQPSHAWLSGQIMRAWGNAAFGSVAPFEDVCLGAEQHDIGWLEWEQAPTFNPVTGRPHGFRELDVASHTAIWRRGTELALAFGRYPALLVSLHGTGLYANYAGAAENAAIVREFLDGQAAIQQWLLASLRSDRHLGAFCDPGRVDRNRRLVRTADRMSIAICTGMQDLAVRSDDPHVGVVRLVPTEKGETDIRLAAPDGDLARITVSPWPFGAAEVRLSCEGFSLGPMPFEDEMAMRLAIRDADKISLAAVLRPA